MILYAIYLILTSKYQITTFEKSAFEPGLFFFQETHIVFELVIFPYFLPNPYTIMCVLTIGSSSLFRKIVRTHGQLQLRSWFFGCYLISDFLFILIIYKRNCFGDPPTSHCQLRLLRPQVAILKYRLLAAGLRYLGLGT